MLDIWLTHAIFSHTIAYWSRDSFSESWLLRISFAYVKHMLDLFWFVQISDIMLVLKKHELFQNTSSISNAYTLHMQILLLISNYFSNASITDAEIRYYEDD
jgi:hypothetical protein